MERQSPERSRVLVAVGSPRDRVCSVGAFARAEALALARVFKAVDVLEPSGDGEATSRAYPRLAGLSKPDVILYHTPSLHDRGHPWRPLTSAVALRAAFPRALFLPIVHEFSEAPRHWRARQIAILKLAHGAIVNTDADLAGLRRWHHNLLKAHLGPTLFIPELLGDKSSSEARGSRLATLRAEARSRIVREQGERYGLSAGERWLLHPGLLTPGKGIDALGRLAPALDVRSRLIVMGGFGPKAADREFASRTLEELRARTRGRLSVVEAPDDELFRRFLLAADLVALPYDAGVSERRSSFLSAMCCGADVWTTIGVFSAALALETSGARTTTALDWSRAVPNAVGAVVDAFAESDERKIERRLENIEWARGRSWESRVEKIAAFVASLDSRG